MALRRIAIAALAALAVLGVCAFQYSAPPPAFTLTTVNLGSFANVITTNGTFTTAASVPTYRVLLVGGGGGGGSSTGVGFGGNGGTANLEICDVVGAGAAYTVTIGTAGAKGAPGASGGNGGDSSIQAGTGALACLSTHGSGGIFGIGTNGSGGSAGISPGLSSIVDGSPPANTVGLAFQSGNGQVGPTGGAAAINTLGIAGGIGCAGASCTTNTAGQAGKVIFAPEF